jgi:hypothetical protein
MSSSCELSFAWEPRGVLAGQQADPTELEAHLNGLQTHFDLRGEAKTLRGCVSFDREQRYPIPGSLHEFNGQLTFVCEESLLRPGDALYVSINKSGVFSSVVRSVRAGSRPSDSENAQVLKIEPGCTR